MTENQLPLGRHRVLMAQLALPMTGTIQDSNPSCFNSVLNELWNSSQEYCLHRAILSQGQRLDHRSASHLYIFYSRILSFPLSPSHPDLRTSGVTVWLLPGRIWKSLMMKPWEHREHAARTALSTQSSWACHTCSPSDHEYASNQKTRGTGTTYSGEFYLTLPRRAKLGYGLPERRNLTKTHLCGSAPPWGGVPFLGW